MSDLGLVVAVAAVTYASRVVFLLRQQPVPGGLVGRFVEVFPLALFVSLATLGLAAPDGTPAVTPALAGAAGGVIGAVLTRRSLLGVVVAGAVAYWLARALLG